MKTLRQWDEEYSDDQGIWPVWSTLVDEATPYWEVVREFSPLRWALGVDVQREVGDRNWPNWLAVSVQVGPWSLALRRVWPTREAKR